MAWGRVVSLKVGIGNPGIDGAAVDVSNLRIKFNVRRSRKYQDNHAEFTIYNVAPETRKKFFIVGATVVFGAGYEDEDAKIVDGVASAPTIFWGYITLAHTKQVDTEWETKLVCKVAVGMHEPSTTKTTKATKTKAATTKVVAGVVAAVSRVYLSINYAPKTTAYTIINDLCIQLGLTLIGGDLLKAVVLPNGYNCTGSINLILGELRYILEDNALGIFEEANSALVVYRLGVGPDATQELSATLLTFDCGLLGLEELENEIITPSAAERSAWNLKEDDKQIILKKVQFKSIMNANIAPNNPVMIDTPELRGSYLVDVADYVGSTWEDDFDVTAQAVG